MGNIERIVVVRHGEGEGDVRRANQKKGLNVLPGKPTILEELTPRGREQSRTAGLYVQENLLSVNGLAARFDLFVVAPSPRTGQTAKELGLDADWQIDERLGEFNRGDIRGWWPEKHQAEYPESYKQMINDPLNWIPPGATESKRSMAHGRVAETIDEWDQRGYKNVFAVGHRDWEHALLIHVLGEKKAAQIDTGLLEPASILIIEHHPYAKAGSDADISARLIYPWAPQQEFDLIAGSWREISQ